MNTLGERIKQIRLAKKMSQEELGEKIGFGCIGQFVEEYENGGLSPCLIVLNNIAKALNVSVFYLMNGTLNRTILNHLKADGILDDVCNVETMKKIQAELRCCICSMLEDINMFEEFIFDDFKNENK